MRSLPTNVADSGSNMRWGLESYLEICKGRSNNGPARRV